MTIQMTIEPHENFYVETVHKFRVMRRMKPAMIPADMAAEMRINGIDPENHWTLVYSTPDRADAEDFLAGEMNCWGRAHDVEVWEREEEQIKRLMW